MIFNSPIKTGMRKFMIRTLLWEDANRQITSNAFLGTLKDLATKYVWNKTKSSIIIINEVLNDVFEELE